MLLRAPAAIWLQMILPGSVKNVAPALMQRILDAYDARRFSSLSKIAHNPFL